jgi:hypothetical protein
MRLPKFHRAVLVGVILAIAVNESPADEVDLSKLRPEMLQSEVRKLLGPPKRIARQILYRRYLEQWVYDGPKPVRIDFNCVRGEEPKILTVHPLPAPAP